MSIMEIFAQYIALQATLQALDKYLAARQEEINKALIIDKRLKADPYDNIARWTEVKNVKKLLAGCRG